MQRLREIIRYILLEEEILAEPDETNQEEHDKEEQAVAGATTPLGTDSTYPGNLKKKHKKRQKKK